MEYLEHFGLSREPFRHDVDEAFQFDSTQQNDALRRLTRGALAGKGLCVLIGEVGCGKSTVARELFHSVDEQGVDASLLVMMQPGMDALSFLTRLAIQLGVETPSSDRVGIVGQIFDHLASVRREGHRACVIVDEAQMLTGAETLEAIRGLLNLEIEGERLMTLVLVGLSSLGQGLSLNPALSERVEVRVRLGGFDGETGAAYLAHRISAAGGNPEILGPDATSALQKWSKGRARLLNTLADNALFEAFVAGVDSVSATHVDRAAQDLGLDGASIEISTLASSERSPVEITDLTGASDDAPVFEFGEGTEESLAFDEEAAFEFDVDDSE